ncbi:MAG: zinc-dependent alcohol dehydrogenase family protein [Candidatus Aminicenantaceae bacterium]
MRAMVIKSIADLKKSRTPLEMVDLPIPELGNRDLLLKVKTCGVCHTEIDEIEGRTPPPKFPVVPGHEIIGIIEETGSEVKKYKAGERVGVGWIFSSCLNCQYCKNGNENLCDNFVATGRDVNGGYAEYMVVNENFAFSIPEIFSDSQAAPLMCAGAIGYRSLNLTKLENGENIGLTGFGASAHLVLKMVRYIFPDTKIYVFARNKKEREFSRQLGAVWAGDTEDISPEKLHAIIDSTPVWKPVVEALKNLNPGGRLVVNAVRKEDVDKEYLLKLNYTRDLWLEKEIKSVANVARGDLNGFLKLGAEMSLKPEIQEYALEDANRALTELKAGGVRGAKVLTIS